MDNNFSLDDNVPFLSAIASSLASPLKPHSSIPCIVESCKSGSAFTCPHCGNHYCNRHAGSPLMCAMLSDSGEFDPANGTKKRICVYCYWEKRPGYEDAKCLPTISHMDQFKAMRQSAIEKLELNISRMDRRMQKLAEFDDGGGGIGSVTFREYCQRIIPWTPDDLKNECPICGTKFNAVFQRKHHCRLCGDLVCKNCSIFIPLRVVNNQGSKTFELRSCKKCNDLLFKYSCKSTQNHKLGDEALQVQLEVKWQFSIRNILA